MTNKWKYLDIISWTKEQISQEKMKPGDRFFSEASLGEMFGFSRQTVRRALQTLEEDGYICRARGSGTFIADVLPLPRIIHESTSDKKSSMTIGFISAYHDDYIFPGTIRGSENVFTQNGYAIQLVFTQNIVAAETQALQNMLSCNPDGLIVFPTKSGLPCANLSLYDEIRRRGIPLVFIDSYHEGVSAPYVALDDESAGHMAARYLYSMGHRRIGGLFAFSNRQGHHRYLGYAKALMELGLGVRDDHVFWYSKENLPEILTGKSLLKGLAECTAVVCYNDKLALNLIDILKQNGVRVPDDLSVLGIDNCELASVCDLTSIAHPLEKLGEAAANLLLSMIRGEKPRNIIFPPKLIQRGSVRNIGV